MTYRSDSKLACFSLGEVTDGMKWNPSMGTQGMVLCVRGHGKPAD